MFVLSSWQEFLSCFAFHKISMMADGLDTVDLD